MQTIDVNTVEERIDRVPVFDVRGDDEYRQEHIAGAKSAPVGSLETRIHDVLEPEAEVIVHCTNPDCELSRQAAERLESLGHSNVFRFTGGIEAWKEAGLPTVSS